MDMRQLINKNHKYIIYHHIYYIHTVLCLLIDT
jgi:hypothetical protein